MATDDELRAQQHEAERAETAPWTDYPPTPRWYPPSVGLGAAAMTAAFTLLDGAAWKVAVIASLVVIELGFLAWYRRYRGTMPTGLLGSMHSEIAAAARRFLGWLVAIAAVVVAAALLAPGWLAPVLALLAVTPLVTHYETTYAAAAAATRARLT